VKDLFHFPIHIDSAHDFKIVTIDCPDHRYRCFLTTEEWENMRTNDRGGHLYEWMLHSEIVIQDDKIIKDKEKKHNCGII
jgi:hypothetical protein